MEGEQHMIKTRYKVCYINARTGKPDYIRDHKGNIRYYSHAVAEKQRRILKGRKASIVRV